jgi:hypothetical protein
MGLRLIDAVNESGLRTGLRPAAVQYARRADDDGRNCFPGLAHIANCLNVGVKIARRHRDGLIELGVLSFRTIKRGGRSYREIVAFHADRLPPRVATKSPTSRTLGADRTAGVARRVASMGPKGPPTSISTSKVRITTTPLASGDAASTDAAIRQCFSAFVKAFRARSGAKPKITPGKDARLFKELIALWGVDAVLGLIPKYFSSGDPRVANSDYTVGAFYALANRLMLAETRPDRRTAENLDAGERAKKQLRPAVVTVSRIDVPIEAVFETESEEVTE